MQNGWVALCSKVNMSHKLARKIRQLYARDVRKLAHKELSILPHVLKSRRWWMPKLFWKIGVAVFVDRKKLEELIKSQNHATKS